MGCSCSTISDTCILGFDFLKTYGAKLDLEAGTLRLNDSVIPALAGINNSGETFSISRVITTRKTVIPSNTAVRIQAKIAPPVTGSVIIQPIEKKSSLLMPKILVQGDSTCIVTFLNILTTSTLLKRSLYGMASEAGSVDDSNKKDTSEVLFTFEFMNHDLSTDMLSEELELSARTKHDEPEDDTNQGESEILLTTSLMNHDLPKLIRDDFSNDSDDSLFLDNEGS